MNSQQDLRKRIEAHSTAELQRMLQNESHQYTEEALAIARDEAKRRSTVPTTSRINVEQPVDESRSPVVAQAPAGLGSCLAVLGALVGLLGLITLIVQIAGSHPNKGANILVAMVMLIVATALAYGGRRLRRAYRPLSLADFPGAELAQFAEWHEAVVAVRRATNRELWISLSGLALLLLFRGAVGVIFFAASLVGLFLYIFLVIRPLGQRVRTLREKLNAREDRLPSRSDATGTKAS